MNAIASIRSVPGSIDVRSMRRGNGPADPPASGKRKANCVPMASSPRCYAGYCERSNVADSAEIAQRIGPLSLDDAWAGGWYARSRERQEPLYPASVLD